MPEAPKIAEISASLTRGEDYSPETLRFDLSINTYPGAKVSVIPSALEELASPVSTEILEQMAKLQEHRLSGVDTADTQITAYDGRDNSLQFDGFMSAPVLALNKFGTSNSLSVVGEASIMDSLDLSIYDSSYMDERPEANGTGPVLDPQPAAEDGDLIQVILGLTESLVDNLDHVLEMETHDTAKELIQRQHDINIGDPLKLWLELLNNSDVVFDSWPKLFPKSAGFGRRVTQHVKELLVSRTPGFWNVMRSLMGSYQMFYLPEYSGPGRFVRADEKVGKEGETVDVSVGGLTVADGSPRLLSPGGVTMYGAGAAAERPEGGTVRPRVIAYWPQPLQPGFIHKEVPPYWLLRPKTGVPILGSELAEGQDITGKDSEKKLSLKEYKKKKEDTEDFKKEVDGAFSGVMTERCMIVFKELQLAHATAALNIPLDFSVDSLIGSRITVNVLGADDSSGGKFTAFVSSISHDIALQQGKQLQSSTNLRCTHVKF